MITSKVADKEIIFKNDPNDEPTARTATLQDEPVTAQEAETQSQKLAALE